MKPVFIENTVQQLKALIAKVEQKGNDTPNYDKVLSDIEQELKNMPDEKDNLANILLLTLLLLPIAGYLIYTGYYWPWLVLVAWIGALVYYRTNEKALSIATLQEKAKVNVRSPMTKVNYLLSGITQKVERLQLVRLLNMLFWPFVIFMGQLLLYADTSAYVLWSILLVIATINAVFWRQYFRPQKEALAELESDLHQLNSSLILHSNKNTYQAPLYFAEEE